MEECFDCGYYQNIPVFINKVSKMFSQSWFVSYLTLQYLLNPACLEGQIKYLNM